MKGSVRCGDNHRRSCARSDEGMEAAKMRLEGARVNEDLDSTQDWLVVVAGHAILLADPRPDSDFTAGYWQRGGDGEFKAGARSNKIGHRDSSRGYSSTKPW